MLDQASFHSIQIPPDLESIFELTSIKEEEDTKPHISSVVDSPPPVARKRKYALMQKLPTGDYWTSLSSDASTDTRDIKDLPVGYSELVAILPSAAPSLPSSSSIPPLGSYKPKKSLAPRPKLPQPRQVSCGAFLDYGPFASFAPSFDQAGVEIGRLQLGEVAWGKEERKRARKIAVEHCVQDDDDRDIGMIEVQDPAERSVGSVEETFHGLLSKEQIEDIKSTLGSLELEVAVQELLERNARALKRLEDLQAARLASEGGGTSEAEGGSEEWDTGEPSFIFSINLLLISF